MLNHLSARFPSLIEGALERLNPLHGSNWVGVDEYAQDREAAEKG
jgi:hypothetical protein